LITIEHNSNSNLLLEFMAFKGTLEAGDDGCHYAQLDHIHAEFHDYYDLDDIGPLLEVEFICDSEVYYGLGCYLCALEVGFIDVLLDVESQAAEVAGCGSVRPIELEVGIYIAFATCAAKGRSDFNYVHLLVGKWGDPNSDGKICFVREGMQGCSGCPQEARIDFRIFADIEALGGWKCHLSFLISVFIVGLYAVRGVKEGSSIVGAGHA
jgi:hypothetical protein